MDIKHIIVSEAEDPKTAWVHLWDGGLNTLSLLMPKTEDESLSDVMQRYTDMLIG